MTYRIIPDTDQITSSDCWVEGGIYVPDLIFRAIHISGLEKAFAEGFEPGWDGLVYFADTAPNAANFLALRMPASEIVAVGLVTTDIELERFDIGRDHAPDFWPGEVFTIFGAVGAEHIDITEIYEFSGADEVDA